MASSCVSFSEDLTCSICLSVYTEPVMLLCGHSFCRQCISLSLDTQKHCPLCRSGVDKAQLLTSHALKSLVEKTKKKLEYRQDKENCEFLCPDHDEQLKLYCITDQQLICVICRDAQKHEFHKFKPVDEAAPVLRDELKRLLHNLSVDIGALVTLVQLQKEELDSTTQRSGELKSLISTKFKELYQFLEKREQELANKVTSCVEAGLKKMTRRLCYMEAAIDENRKLQASVTSALQVQDHKHFLKEWIEVKKAKAVRGPFKSKVGNIQVEKTDLSLGPYESHLQMFVWKEMLQVVTPREEQLLLRSDQTSLMVSRDHSSATFCPSQRLPTLNNMAQNQLPKSTQSTGKYEGQHYWEVYLGQHRDWELGIPNTFLKRNVGAYQMHTSGLTKSLAVEGKLQKIGLYLNCPRKELSFYNADTMVLLCTASLASTSFPVSAHFKLGNSLCHDPLTVCKY